MWTAMGEDEQGRSQRRRLSIHTAKDSENLVLICRRRLGLCRVRMRHEKSHVSEDKAMVLSPVFVEAWIFAVCG